MHLSAALGSSYDNETMSFSTFTVRGRPSAGNIVQILCISQKARFSGLDLFKHGEAAYPIEAYGHGWPPPESINFELF